MTRDNQKDGILRFRTPNRDDVAGWKLGPVDVARPRESKEQEVLKERLLAGRLTTAGYRELEAGGQGLVLRNPTIHNPNIIDPRVNGFPVTRSVHISTGPLYFENIAESDLPNTQAPLHMQNATEADGWSPTLASAQRKIRSFFNPYPVTFLATDPPFDPSAWTTGQTRQTRTIKSGFVGYGVVELSRRPGVTEEDHEGLIILYTVLLQVRRANTLAGVSPQEVRTMYFVSIPSGGIVFFGYRKDPKNRSWGPENRLQAGFTLRVSGTGDNDTDIFGAFRYPNDVLRMGGPSRIQRFSDGRSTVGFSFENLYAENRSYLYANVPLSRPAHEYFLTFTN